MRIPRTCLVIVAGAAMIACGPPRLGTNETGADSSDDDSTQSTTEASEGEAGGPSTSGPTFVWHDDVGVVECDPWAQDCAEGEKCVPYASTGGTWDANKCVVVMGDGAPGEPCTYGGVVAATDDCDATSVCWDVQEVDGEAIGACLPFCKGAPDMPECPPKSTCLIPGNGAINLCIPTCDPLARDCGDGLACYWDGSSFMCIFTTRDLPAGQPCGYINDCAAGLICADAESLPACDGASCCTSFCELALGDGPCEALLPGTVCVPFFDEGWAPDGYEHVGLCTVAPP